MTRKRIAPMMIVLGLAAAACGSDDDGGPVVTDGAPATEVPAATEAPAATDPPAATDAADVVTGPATISADDQSGDGTSVVASVTLPTPGFIVVHADADGPGPILGSSELLPAGENVDVVIALTTAIDASATVWPMAHVDANGNGEYEFAPPDVTIDVPAVTADGAVAVLPVSYTVGDAGAGEDAAAVEGLALTTTDLGDVLVGPGGFTVYLFSPDSAAEPTCYDDCEATWPVVEPQTDLGEGLDAALVGTVERTDGVVQATYGGWPLYTFAGDAAPGDTNGQSVGDVWFVVGADGNGISGA